MSTVLERSAEAAMTQAAGSRASAADVRPIAPEPGGDGVTLPRFAVQESGSLFIDVSRIEAPDHFVNFAERVFGNGLLFNRLDYDVLQRALHVGGTAAGNSVGRLRLAAGIAPFPRERRALYKMVKINGAGEAEEAEYVFEPGEVEKTVEVTVEVPADEKGGAPTLRKELRKVSEPAEPRFDEFVADMWGKGARFGLDVDAVKKALPKREVARVIIARALAPTAGSDASIQEQSDTLHRNNTPRLLPDGRVDLASFQNRYPMVAAGTTLIRKIPRKLGDPGRRVGGEIIEPDMPADVDLKTLSGLGTEVQSRKEGDFLVAIVPGFLMIDTKSHQMSVTEKIVSHEGVNLRTTGNLSLADSDFEEHGEVQENRSVEGKNMTFHGLVCGIISSHAGKIRLKDISGGQAKSPQGSITATGRASRATFEAPGGEITLAHAEGCVILGGRVKIEHAVGCQIVGDTVEITTAEGCTVSGKAVRIGAARPTRSAETVVIMLTPDSSEMDRRLREMRADLGKLNEALREKSRLGAEAREQPELKNYLLLEARVRSGELKLTPAQEMSWPRLAEKVAPLLHALRKLIEDARVLKGKHEELSKQIDSASSESAAAASNRQCEISQMGGDTYVRCAPFPSGASSLSLEQEKEVLARLRNASNAALLFSGASGEFKWKYEKGARSGMVA